MTTGDYGWWKTGSDPLLLPGQGPSSGIGGSGSLPMARPDARRCRLKDMCPTLASMYPQADDVRIMAPMVQRGIARPDTQAIVISLSVRSST